MRVVHLLLTSKCNQSILRSKVTEDGSSVYCYVCREYPLIANNTSSLFIGKVVNDEIL